MPGLKYVSPLCNRRLHFANKRIVTTSLDVSVDSGKRHDNIVRAIQALTAADPALIGEHYFPERGWGDEIASYDMTAYGVWLIVKNKKFRNEPDRGFVVQDWLRNYLKLFDEAEAGRVIWLIRDKLEHDMCVAPDGHPVILYRSNLPVRQEWVDGVKKYGEIIARLLKDNGLDRPPPHGTLALDPPRPRQDREQPERDDWGELMDEIWGDR